MWTLVALGGAALIAQPLQHRLGRTTGWPLAALFLALLGAFASQAPTVLAGRPVILEFPWIATLDVAFRLRLDGLSLMFCFIVLGVGTLILAYCTRYFPKHAPDRGLFALLCLFAMAMLGLVLADDLLLLFVFWELTTISSFFLIGGAGPSAVLPARQALLTTVSGGLALLGAVVLVSVTAGTTRISLLLENPELLPDGGPGVALVLLVFLAAVAKSAQVPLHFWLPAAMAASTPVSAYLHAATMVKAGIYLLMRLSPAFSGRPLWIVLLLTTGLVTALLGATLALKQHDLKALLAYSTVSQLGFLVALIGVGTPEAFEAATVHTVAHALFKATLFMLVGIIDHEAGSRDVRRLNGLRKTMPVTAALTALAALSLAGIPPALGFVSKEKILAAFLEVSGPPWLGEALAGVAVLASALTFAYGFRLFHGTFIGPLTQPSLHEPTWQFLLPAAVAAVAGIVLGFAVPVLDPLVEEVIAATHGIVTDPHLTLWPGLSPELLLSALTILLGTVLFLARHPVDRWLHRWDTPVRAEDLFDRGHDSVVHLGAGVGAPTAGFAPVRHLLPVLALLVALGVSALLLRPPLGPRISGATVVEDWFLAAIITSTVAGLMVARSRVAAVSLMGLVGFVVSVWFLLLGAPDLALTQLLIEVLTVAVAVLVLRRLPTSFHPVRRTRTAVVLGVAVACGAVAAAGTYAFTGRRELSPGGRYFLTETEELTGGSNAVNTVLVDFRALDTLGEVTVLAVVALGLAALLHGTSPSGWTGPRTGGGPIHNEADNLMVIRVWVRLLSPIVVALSVYLLFRGHYSPGGGFVAGLVGGAGIALAHVSAPGAPLLSERRLGPPLVGFGLLVAALTGLLGFVEGSYLRSLHGEVALFDLTVGVSTALLFDVGLYLVVIGLVVTAVNRMDIPSEESGDPRREERT
ncbi:hydrogen gas-evolving membrane-bound hydrogenase subunit E [Thermobifida halotolerans]|uniref:hydrogen gas-evolving membrane-bound hydrogenase subunit E n=1 Tax=Thermobifida halotolerans TaxID=483545 RepID=UPI001F46DE4F|nr:hydrogen gas-evolving membrane-bound hydrogenase subunit E [Thermobifida halotolerans]